MVDLHIHTDASADGQHSPMEIFTMSRALGLRCVAFADHNTLASLAQGFVLARETGVEFIPAVEINTELNGVDIHLLGYGVDPFDEQTRLWFDEIATVFADVARRRTQRFNELGLELTWERVNRHAGGKMPTASSFYEAIVENPLNHHHPLIEPYRTGPQSDNRYVHFYFEVLANGGPADIGDAALPVLDVIARLRALRIVPVVAHPRELSEAALREMIAAGLLGVEAYCSYHDAAQGAHWRGLTDRYGLLYTTGSDFHGRAIKPAVKLGEIEHNDYIVARRLREAIAALA
ncbi:MAG TPA: PHP domain-containing protein [bacterium]|nr:PHP domain-containing protein [bacterium]